MKWVTHTICMLSIIACINRYLPLSALSICVGVFGSLAPDIIERSLFLKHRNKHVHNFLTGLTTLFVLSIIDPSLFTLGLGYVHHLMLDITKGGVYAGKERIKSPLESKNALHNVLMILLHLFFIFM